ncbi:MAG TPA: alpha-L-rhamnosidase C-terminal domain-containing protein, partial [Fimbriimonadaceae bacterium]|nr:alpha-L-rhamnosidase C-terminal domain-containing protein [Fimbriimonadaceae bacterium]
TRIQVLIGYYLGRDRRLQRNAIENLGWSMMDTGLTYSRYPSRQTQIIPPFSLWWAMMLYDQMLYDSERSFGVEAINMAANAIDGYHRSLIDKTFWHFWDWVPDWHGGVPPGYGGTMGWCLVETARIAKMKRLSRALFSVADDIAIQMDEPDSEEDDDHLDHFREGLEDDFEYEDGLVRHIVDEDWTPSEHTEAMFRQYQMILGMEPSPWPYAALERANAAKCTYYFSYYKHLAMQPDDYMAQLGPWKEMIESGLSTFAENPEPVRSDCHAWSAHPALGFFQFIAGVTSVAPAWKRARIAPKPGSLRRFDARIAHPDGELRVAYEDGKLTVDTPVPAHFAWQGKTQLLRPGKHKF